MHLTKAILVKTEMWIAVVYMALHKFAWHTHSLSETDSCDSVVRENRSAEWSVSTQEAHYHRYHILLRELLISKTNFPDIWSAKIVIVEVVAYDRHFVTTSMPMDFTLIRKSISGKCPTTLCKATKKKISNTTHKLD